MNTLENIYKCKYKMRAVRLGYKKLNEGPIVV
jgi:hypothetical protein